MIKILKINSMKQKRYLKNIKNTEKLNEFLENNHEILFKDFDKNFSTSKIKRILIGCVLYIKIYEMLTSDEKKNLNVPKILGE